MPHRVDSTSSSGGTATISSSHSSHHGGHHSHRRPGPYDRPSPPPAPPIATLPLTHSPTPSSASLDRSTVSTPPVGGSAGRRPSSAASQASHQHQFPLRDGPPPPPPGSGGYSYSSYSNGSSRYGSGDDSSYHLPGLGYNGANGAPPPPTGHGYPPNGVPQHLQYSNGHQVSYHPPPHPNQMGGGMPMNGLLPPQGGGMPSHPNSLSAHGHHSLPPHLHHQHSGGGGQPLPVQMVPSNYNIVYTEDAATKLSDRVRRRCFNCCTTDTSTWRRSNLSPGKVLCNKCGLFERTHSRPRPEQFPHKRGGVGEPAGRPPPQQMMGSPHMNGSSPHLGMQQGPGQPGSPRQHSRSPPQSNSPSANGGKSSSVHGSPHLASSTPPPHHSSSHNGTHHQSSSHHGSPQQNGHSLPPLNGYSAHPLSNSHVLPPIEKGAGGARSSSPVRD